MSVECLFNSFDIFVIEYENFRHYIMRMVKSQLLLSSFQKCEKKKEKERDGQKRERRNTHARNFTN